MKKSISSIVFLILLVGCRLSAKQEPSLTPTIHPFTSKPIFTSTSPAVSSSTPSVTYTRTHTPTVTRMPIPSPTVDLAAAVVAAQSPELFSSYPSPDGMLRMDILLYDCVKTIDGGDENAYEQLILVDLASGEERIADDQLQYCGGLGAYGFGGRFWSSNSRYFYYTDGRQGIPDGCGYWDSPLLRFDVASLENESLGAGSLSPDGNKVATWNSMDNVVNIWDIDDGEISHFTPLNSAAGSGPIIWSPDSQSLVYIQVDSWCPVSGKSYLVQVAMADSKQSLLLESENPTFADAEWDDTDVLSLFDQEGKAWRYNLITGVLTSVP